MATSVQAALELHIHPQTLLMRTRPSTSPLLIGSSHLQKKVSTWELQEPPGLFFQQVFGWLKSPMRIRTCECEAVYICHLLSFPVWVTYSRAPV